MSDISLDIETLGTSVGAVVLSIGAVRFDLKSGTFYDEFYVNIDPLSSILQGMTTDADTIKWWADPERDEARKYLKADQKPLADALEEFGKWCRVAESKNIFAKPPAFDCALTERAYQMVGQPVPWTHRQPLCVRTVIRWTGFDDKSIPFKGVEHYALDDAKHQARIVCAAWAA
jgi:hypothetical protein